MPQIASNLNFCHSPNAGLLLQSVWLWKVWMCRAGGETARASLPVFIIELKVYFFMKWDQIENFSIKSSQWTVRRPARARNSTTTTKNLIRIMKENYKSSNNILLEWARILSTKRDSWCATEWSRSDSEMSWTIWCGLLWHVWRPSPPPPAMFNCRATLNMTHVRQFSI